MVLLEICGKLPINRAGLEVPVAETDFAGAGVYSQRCADFPHLRRILHK